jgi:hypothetical protein
VTAHQDRNPARADIDALNAAPRPASPDASTPSLDLKAGALHPRIRLVHPPRTPPARDSDSKHVRRQARPVGEDAAGYRAGLIPTGAGALVVNALVVEVAYLKMAQERTWKRRSERGADSSLPQEKQTTRVTFAVSGSFWEQKSDGTARRVLLP